MANAKPSGKLLKDPFAGQNALRIDRRLPPDGDSDSGYQLCWISERVRESLGWQGWIPLEYGDKYTGTDGELLADYVPDIPRQRTGPDRIDNKVRRKDVILCRLPADWYDARQQAAVLESQGRVKDLEVPEGQPILGPHVTTVGGGLRKDASPGFDIKTPESQELTKRLNQYKQ